jgi:hypothetical protein
MVCFYPIPVDVVLLFCLVRCHCIVFSSADSQGNSNTLEGKGGPNVYFMDFLCCGGPGVAGMS